MSRVILITGATSGYGLETAKLFQENGDTVIIASRTPEKVKKTVADYGFAAGYALDVTKYEQWADLKEQISKDFGTVDVLINNAGGGVNLVATVDQTKETIDEAIQLNLSSAIYGANVFAPGMIAQEDGVIINVSSICARHQWPTWTIYGCAKAGLLSFSTLDVELYWNGDYVDTGKAQAALVVNRMGIYSYKDAGVGNNWISNIKIEKIKPISDEVVIPEVVRAQFTSAEALGREFTDEGTKYTAGFGASIVFDTGKAALLHPEIMVLKYNRETGEFSQALIEDVAVGQEVFVRQRYWNIREIVILYN